MTCVFNNMETRAVIKFFFLQGKAPKEIDAVLTETLACWAKDLSAPGKNQLVPLGTAPDQVMILNFTPFQITLRLIRETGSVFKLIIKWTSVRQISSLVCCTVRYFGYSPPGHLAHSVQLVSLLQLQIAHLKSIY